MTMFVWRSVALQNYARGYIIVEATGAPEARRKAIAEFDNNIGPEHFGWSSDYLASVREAFIRDLEGEVLETEVICLFGSE